MQHHIASPQVFDSRRHLINHLLKIKSEAGNIDSCAGGRVVSEIFTLRTTDSDAIGTQSYDARLSERTKIEIHGRHFHSIILLNISFSFNRLGGRNIIIVKELAEAIIFIRGMEKSFRLSFYEDIATIK